MLWPSLLAFVEAKYGSSNDRHPHYNGYSTYLSAAGLFSSPDEAIKAEGSYQLTRNWIIGAAIAKALRVPLRLVNLGPATISKHAAGFAALLAQTPDRAPTSATSTRSRARTPAPRRALTARPGSSQRSRSRSRSASTRAATRFG